MFANGTQSLLTDTSHWSAIYNNSNNTFAVQSWVMPTGGGVISFGSNVVGAPTWGQRPGIDPLAQFIWSNDTLADPNGACGTNFQGCTVDFSIPIIPTTPSAVPLPAALPLFASGLGALGLLGWRRKKTAAG
jgi:hypothetical protein